ncbi:hypothetical protein [Cellulosimicrobium cellulans]|nr:hypothetical protein [Cellulosimicrobium cellulans]MDF9877711.1 hypothetical protein [Cellulosimicrobium cellulans]
MQHRVGRRAGVEGCGRELTLSWPGCDRDAVRAGVGLDDAGRHRPLGL